MLRLCDATGIRSIAEFDARFPMTQSLYNWSQDLQNTLWNAGLRDHELLLARIGVCEEALRRFPREDQLMAENCRRALAESYFEAGLTGKAEELYTAWLAADPGWGWGWIGWADCYSAAVASRATTGGPRSCCDADTRCLGSATRPTSPAGCATCARKRAGR